MRQQHIKWLMDFLFVLCRLSEWKAYWRYIPSDVYFCRVRLFIDILFWSVTRKINYDKLARFPSAEATEWIVPRVSYNALCREFDQTGTRPFIKFSPHQSWQFNTLIISYLPAGFTRMRTQSLMSLMCSPTLFCTSWIWCLQTVHIKAPRHHK